jgi:hypothetical protein
MANSSFTIYATESRLSKGLLAIPRKFTDRFPATKGKIFVVFDDGTKVETKVYLPYDPKIKECRIFGLSGWFTRRKIIPGDAITISVEDSLKGVYRIALDRFVRERRTKEARRNLYTTESPQVASEQLRRLAEAKRQKLQTTAFDEISLMAQRPVQRRKRSVVLQTGRAEAVPAPLRALLEAVHQGKCQICNFTFDKRDGSPYFEIHHLEADKGHHPTNVLVICPNCHAQMENAVVTEMERMMGWLVRVRINGKRRRVRQPFVPKRPFDARPIVLMFFVAVRIVTTARMH